MKKKIADYDRAAEILKAALMEMKRAGIADQEVPPVLVDFGMMIAVALVGSAGVDALVMRMRQEILDVERGKLGRSAQKRALRSS